MDASKIYRRTRHGPIVSIIKMSFAMRFVHSLTPLMASLRLCGTIFKSETSVSPIIPKVIFPVPFIKNSLQCAFNFWIYIYIRLKDCLEDSHCNYRCASRKPEPARVADQHALSPPPTFGVCRLFASIFDVIQTTCAADAFVLAHSPTSVMNNDDDKNGFFFFSSLICCFAILFFALVFLSASNLPRKKQS